MPNAFDRLAYGAAQGLRVSWYWGQKLVAASRAERRPMPEAARRRLPDRARLLRDLMRLFARDWRNIAAGIYLPPRGAPPHPPPGPRPNPPLFPPLGGGPARPPPPGTSESHWA